MRRQIFNAIKFGVAGVLSLFILSLFTLIYNYTGIHVTNPSGATDYKWINGQLKSTMVEGFSWFKMDENGFNNSIVLQDSPDILLMGSSHMEATEIRNTENVGYILNQELPYMTTYNIGMSGHDIYRCAKNLGNAVQEYNPTSYVIIETDTTCLKYDEINSVLQEEMDPIKSYDSGIMYILQRYCPAIKSLYKQISDWRYADRLFSNEENNGGSNASYYDYSAFIHKMKEDCGENTTLIIFFQPAYSIDMNGNLVFEENNDSIDLFAQACKDNDVVFINMTDRFCELYEQDFILAHGFSNTGIGVGHLNKFGHGMIANELVEYIEEDMQ